MAQFRIDLDWRTTVVSAMLFPLLIGLGVWQLQRAEEKAAIAQQWEQRRQQPPVLLQSVDSTDADKLEYLPVKLGGTFLAKQYFLLDNRVHRGQFGYEVLGILQMDNGGPAVLVNRGWIVGDPSRLELPQVPVVGGHVTLTGHVYVAPGVPYLLADTPLEPNWPKRIQAIEMKKLGSTVLEVAPGQLFPYSVRLDSGSSGALTVDWQIVNISPAKHTGYAVQWFAMALALFILYILRSSNLWQVLTSVGRTH